MPHARLNLLSLRADRVPWRAAGQAAAGDSRGSGNLREPGDPAGSVGFGPPARPISRRRLLGLAAGAAGAAGTGSAVRALARAVPEDFDLDVSPGRATFLVGGIPRWIVDAGRFAGDPRLAVTRGAAETVLALASARFPGTAIAADFQCRLRRTADGWRMRLAWPAIGLAAEAPFLDWLTGDAVLRARARVAHVAWPLGRHAVAALGGAATATFQPDWSLRLAGAGVARITGLHPDRDVPCAADLVVVRLPDASAASVLTRPDSRRTLVTLARGEHAWALRPTWSLPDGARLDWRAEPFDSLHLESDESAIDGPRHVAVLDGAATISEAEGINGDQGLNDSQSTYRSRSLIRGGPPARPVATFHPAPRATGVAGEPFALPLGRVRCAVAWDGAGEERSLMGWLGGAAPWLVTPAGVAAQLGDPGGAPAFEAVAGPGTAPVLDVSPAVLDLRLPLAGARAETRLPAGARGVFTWPHPHPSRATRGVPSPADAGEGRRGSASSAAGAPVVVDLRAGPDGVDAVAQAQAFDLVVFRPDDLLALGFSFDNLIFRAGANPGEPGRLVAADSRRAARLVVHFPPQHITERVSLDEGQPVLEAPAPPIPAALASASRLAFEVPASLADGIPFTLEGMLDWNKLTPVPGPLGTVKRPTPWETALVVPYRLVLHPETDDHPAWAHARSPVTFGGRTELWHTRLGRDGADGSREVAGVDEVDERQPPRLRAVWTESFDPSEQIFLGCNHQLVGDPFAPMSLTPSDRKFITMLTGSGADRIATRRLFLSALGAWLDVTFDRSPGNDNCQTSLESWTHKAAMGRDFYVRVVYRGTLLPFGHRAVLIKITERKFEKDPAEDVVAALWQRQFLIVREPERAYNNRKFPFRRVRILTESTPSLRLSVAKAKLGALPADGTGGFWPVVLVDGVDRDFPFQVIATDWDDRTVELTAPMAWLAEGADAAVARTAYNAETGERVKRPMAGQKVAFAASGGGGGETRLETAALTFAMDAAGIAPILRRAGVIVEPLKNLIGDRTPVDIVYDDTYLAHGFAAAQNVAEIFAKLESKLPIDFGGGGRGDRGGGLVTPNFDISGLSRKLGVAAGDLANLAAGTFDPADFLDVSALASKAKILGFAILDKILATIPPAEFGDGGKVPRVVTRVDVPAQLAVTEIDWSPKVIQFPPFKFNEGGTSAFQIHAELRARLDAGAGASADFDVHCELTFFAIDLVAIKLTLERLKFTAGSGKSTSLVPEITAVAFGGPLKFIEKLKEVMSSDVLGVGPKIDVTPTGILAGISVGLPSVAVGVFSLENIRLSAALNLPLTGEPVRFRFAFCERQSPFILTVSAFGGGGFVAVHLGADGLAKLEMALEFGAQLSMSIGIASGSVGVMAGIYLELTKNEEGGTDVLLTGYLRCWGELDILGLISISAEFYLAFTYDSARNSCRGQAKLTVKIEILFWEKTFTLTVEREFRSGGGGGFLAAADGAALADGGGAALADAGGRATRPGAGGRAGLLGANSRAGLLSSHSAISFDDLYAEPDWVLYCGAFAS